LLQPSHVDQRAGVGQPQPQQRQQRLPAGQRLGVLTRLGQRLARLLEGAGTDVLEGSGDHAAPPFALCRARQTRSGVHGIRTSFTPYGRSASTTALTTAGVAAMVPASPTPLTPSGLVVAGVSVRSVTNSGRSAAVGSR